MMKLLSFIFQIAVLAAVALWLADRPGTARIVWHDTVIETSAAFLALCVLALGYALHLVLRLWHFLRNGPVHWRLRRKIGRMETAQEQLTRGLVAVAAGNATEAGRLAVASRKNMGDVTAALWLQAQAAQMAGDTRAAVEIFRTLTKDDASAILGYRGLITEARRLKDWAEFDRLIEEMQRRKPGTPWVSLMKMESATRRGQWDEAESALGHAAAAHLLDSAEGRRTRAALRVATSRDFTAKGDRDAALKAAEQAAQQAPEWVPAVINLAEALIATEHFRAARRTIERAWKKTPHPQLARLVARLSSDNLDAFRQIEHLCRVNENAPESKRALGEAALAANVWGEARRYLTSCVAIGAATQGTYRQLAQLERREHGDERAAASWLAKGAEAPADPVWLCRSCGGGHEQWQPTCFHCNAFDSLDWASAGQSRAALPSK